MTSANPTRRDTVMALGLLLFGAVGAAAETRRTIVGRPEYDRSGFHEIFMGPGYRKLWLTPVELPILDLKTFAGGLTPVRQVGSKQSVGLALRGADGRAYTFRTTDKDPKRVLPEDWADTLAARLVQDSTVADHPGVGFVLPTLAEAAGVLHTTPQYVVMPDVETLGEFRDTFGGRPGTIEEFPQAAGEGRVAFDGAVEILSTLDLWKRHMGSAATPVDTHALLRARLFDVWIQDWDRHNRQWRWLRRSAEAPFEPLPEDRDHAFSRFGGVFLRLVRGALPQFMEWDDEYRNFEGLLFQGAEVDRWLLAEPGREAFVAAARDLAARLTDGVIDEAVGNLPPEWHAENGASLADALKRRRDELETAALTVYGRLADRVDVHGSDEEDAVRIEGLPGGGLDVALSTAGAAPRFRRTFDARETREIRLYLYGGNDRVVTTGESTGIRIHVVGGPGDDRLENAGPKAQLHDFEGRDTVTGSGPLDRRPWSRRPAKPDETPWLEWRDWGNRTVPGFRAWWEPDPGLLLGTGLSRRTWGFRHYPYRSLHEARLWYGTARNVFALGYDGEWRRSNSPLSLLLEAQASQLENFNFFGYGNESAREPPAGFDEDYFDVRSSTVRGGIAVRWAATPRLRLQLGTAARWTRTSPDQGGRIGDERPFGTGDFAHTGLRAAFALDTAPDSEAGFVTEGFAPRTATSSLRADGAAFVNRHVEGARSSFGGVEGRLRGVLVGGPVAMAARLGGERLWGDAPWFEAASLGGRRTLRGFRSGRFIGDASFYGSLEARVRLTQGRLIVPGEWGVVGFGDAGRVFRSGLESDVWHTAWGGGLFFRLRTLDAVLHAAVARGDETRFYVDYGFMF